MESEDYQSPIGGMFTRAYDRYRQAERERQESGIDDYLRRSGERVWGDWVITRETNQSQREEVIDTRTLDGDNRPPPKSDEELTVKLACKICYTQLANTAVIPCRHMSMCEYCADIQIPVKEHNNTIPKEKSKCPVCRKKVTSRVSDKSIARFSGTLTVIGSNTHIIAKAIIRCRFFCNEVPRP